MRPVSVKHAYDFDGVLAEGPPPNEVAWGKMNGSMRAERKMSLLDHYASAAPIYDPPEKIFWVISARKEEPEIRAISERWLRIRFGGRAQALFLLKGSRTTENVIRYKSLTIAEEGFTDFTEDNLQVVRGVARILPSCRVWLFKDGAPSRWPPVVASSS